MNEISPERAARRGYVELSKDQVARFWTAVDVVRSDTAWAVQLDGRAPKTPAKKPIEAPTANVARMIADEWAAQGRFLDPSTMPATRLASTAIDRIGAAREAVADEIAAYAGSDTLCYLGEGALQRRQVEAWEPWRDWADRELGVRVLPAIGVSHRSQPEASIARVRALALELGDFELTGLAAATALFGSAILGLALLRGAVSGQEAFELSRLEDAFQQSQWGVDAEAAERTDQMRGEAVLLDRWFRALDE